MGETMIQTDIEDFTGRPKQPGIKMITVENKILAPALARAASISGRNGTIPILECALISVMDGCMIIETTDMEIALRQEIVVTGDQTWTVAVNIEAFSNVTRRLPSGASVTLETRDETIICKTGQARASLRTLAKEDFPSFTVGTYPVNFTIEAATFLRLLTHTAPFVSTELSRHYLNGVNLSVQSKDGVRILRAAATDSQRMGIVAIPVPDGIDEMPDIIIPRSSVAECIKLLDGADGTIEVSLSESRLRLVHGATSITTKLIDGVFPEVDHVIPRSNENVFRADTAALTRVLTFVSALTERKGLKAVKLDLSEAGVTVMARDPEAGEATESLGSGDVGYEGAAMEITFQPRFLLDILKLTGDTVEFRFGDASSPCVARAVKDDGAFYIAMPARF